jgi:CheY-like chemotaxis protein
VATPKRILIVDDESKVLFVLGQALAWFGPKCQVETYASTFDALETATRTRCDLVLTGLRSPDMDGITFTESLRALPYDPIVIWMTAYGCCAVRADAERLGVHRCLDKPLEVTDIRRIVSEALWGAVESREGGYVADVAHE